MLVFWKLSSSKAGPVADVTLTTGLWNSFHSHRSGVVPSRWNEVDPIFGVTVKLQNRLAIDVGTTAFYTPTESYKTSAHAEFKLTYNDAARHGFAVNPWVAYWIELQNKATVVFDPVTSQKGSYLTIGVTPTWSLPAGVGVDMATYANFVSSSFYQRFDGSDGGSGLAVVSLAPKISMPLKFLGVTPRTARVDLVVGFRACEDTGESGHVQPQVLFRQQSASVRGRRCSRANRPRPCPL